MLRNRFTCIGSSHFQREDDSHELPVARELQRQLSSSFTTVGADATVRIEKIGLPRSFEARSALRFLPRGTATFQHSSFSCEMQVTCVYYPTQWAGCYLRPTNWTYLVALRFKRRLSPGRASLDVAE